MIISSVVATAPDRKIMTVGDLSRFIAECERCEISFDTLVAVRTRGWRPLGIRQLTANPTTRRETP